MFAPCVKYPTRLRENYFSIDDILTTQEKVPCKFQSSVLGLGFLDPGAEGTDLAAGTAMELPYWLARALCSRKRRIVTVEMPKPYREGYRQILSADANVVDLHKLGPYYYAFGIYLQSFGQPDAGEISNTLLQTFSTRFRRIMDSAQNCLNEDTTAVTGKLDELERVLFRVGQEGLTAFHCWQSGQSAKIVPSTMVTNYRKRKRQDGD
ncbi:DNA replication complex GINS protein PSF3-like [Branchiostoma floridae]|uniref:DNA replication complex GINS protein PSF3 n=1 Tax=Branchiostoma floridae TaxID=7739 RepID=C3XTX5_BRAFL|nr:DNA replication complex GINS protein PSF3-like [Branchiostoma floridae]|eukprot:XP_002612340.1 hypothetical protein BRAFLDRAFT_280858 [Branchiostoma floridae]